MFFTKKFSMKIKLLNITENYWPEAKIFQKKYLKSPQWLRNIKYKVINVDNSFPKYIVKNKEKFKDWII